MTSVMQQPSQESRPATRHTRRQKEQDLMDRFNRLVTDRRMARTINVNHFSTKMAELRSISWKDWKKPYEDLEAWLRRHELR